MDEGHGLLLIMADTAHTALLEKGTSSSGGPALGPMALQGLYAVNNVNSCTWPSLLLPFFNPSLQ